MDVVFSVSVGRVSVSSCICCMFVSCVHPVAILINVAFCIACSLLMLYEDARGDHMKVAYCRYWIMTELYVTSHECLLLFSQSCCFYYFRGFCACT